MPAGDELNWTDTSRWPHTTTTTPRTQRRHCCMRACMRAESAPAAVHGGEVTITNVDPLGTQRDSDEPGFSAELKAEGFDDAQEIGRGGFGIVYRCVQPALDRTVAVKLLTTDLDPDNLERFLREQRAMGRLSGHPNIVNILQVGTTVSGRPYIVMQFHRQGSLDSRIRRGGPLGWDAVLRLGVKLPVRSKSRTAPNSAPRRQTGQHSAHRLRGTAADRLRYRPDRRRIRDHHWHSHRIPGVHRPRSAAR